MMYIAAEEVLTPKSGEMLIDREFLSEFKKRHKMRRADFYTAMIAATALAAAQNSCFPGNLPEDTGIIVAGMYGPQNTTAKFLDELLEYPEDQLLSTAFTHSVHNAAASYVAELLHLTGPSFTMTIGEDFIGKALFCVNACFETGYCSRILLITAAEHGYIDECLRLACAEETGKAGATAHEFVIAQLLTKYESENKYGTRKCPEYNDGNHG